MGLEKKVNWPKAGPYIVAVSGGVDSIVLLHLLKHFHSYTLTLVVAHADHGWRAESKGDAEWVQQLAHEYGMPFELGVLTLKTKAEAEARKARYEFLESVRQKYKATSIITAHHLDDRIETAVFNLLRGTNIYGLASLKSTASVVRPLLKATKKEIIEYACAYNLEWREDTSNTDVSYARNHIRHEVLPALQRDDQNFTENFERLIAEADIVSEQLITLVTELINKNGTITAHSVELPMRFIRALQFPALRHVLLIAIRMLKPGIQLDLKTIDQAALHLKTGRVKRLRKLNNQLNLSVQGDKVSIIANE